MPHLWERVHLDSVLVLILQILPELIKLGPRELPVPALRGFPIVCSHTVRDVGSEGISFKKSPWLL